MVGQTVGKYRVEDRIGRGGMGTVYRAVDETLHREVAIKVLNSELNDPEVAKRFRAEAITVARLSHPGIATIYELFEHDGQWLMVMEFVKGETLERLVERAGPLSAERAADLTMQALAALAHAHALGVVHRDLKPANLMLTESGAVKIMDFGIARVSGSEHLTNVGFMMGTPAYMAPEQVLSQEVDSRADLYAIGVVIYRLTTGRLPFKGETPFALAQSQVNDPPTPIRLARQGLPEWLEQVIEIALAKSPAERFQSAEEFRTTLQRCLAGLPMIKPVDATAPTGMMLTPPGLPTGALSPQTPLAVRTPTAATATGSLAGPGTAGVPVPSPSGSVPALSEMPTQLHSTAGIAVGTGAQPVAAPSGAQPIPSPTGAQVAPTGAVKGPAPKAKGTPVLALAGAAALVIVGIAGALMWRRTAPTPAVVAPAAPTPAAAAPAPDATATPPPPATPPADQPPPPDPSAAAAAKPGAATPAPPTTTAAPKPDASAAPPTGTRATAPPVASRGTAPPPPVPAPAPAPLPASATAPAVALPPIDDAPVAFKDIKFMVIKGTDTQDQDALLNFGNGQMTIIPKDGGTALASVTYATVAHVIYAHTKDPKFDATLPAPPDSLNIHGFMRGTRHWLALQSKTAYVLLRLDDANWRAVLDAVESRCRLKVERVTEGGGY